MTGDELAIDPLRPIIDPHLHLWDILPAPGSPQAPQTFLLPEAIATIAHSGHAITHALFVECHQMYRADGPAERRSLGETAFAGGIAAMSASGGYGPVRIAHRIVGHVDLRLGDAVAPLLEAHCAVAGERFRGIRMATAFSPAGLFGFPCDPGLRDILADPRLRAGARRLAAMDLSLDIWCLHHQLGAVAALADAVPALAIVVDHCGTPDLRAPDLRSGDHAAILRDWAAAIADLARRPNVRIKLGGLGMDLSRPIADATGAAGSAELAAAWRPVVERCIDAFSPARCMFESNYPPDRAAGGYGAIWNAFKIIAAGHSAADSDRLFRGTAAETYRIDLEEEGQGR